MLFIVALPASSAFALIANIFEVKGDSWKMLHLYQRPVPVLCEDIGECWYQYGLVITDRRTEYSRVCLNRIHVNHVETAYIILQHTTDTQHAN